MTKPAFQIELSQVFSRTMDASEVIDAVLYRRDETGQEYVANLEAIPWEKFEGCLEDRHRVELEGKNLRRLAAITVKFITREPLTKELAGA